jgi:hypothetical protein
MSGTETYHGLSQPFRIQKRLVLNQCFRKISSVGFPTNVQYVTFGGEDLYDVMDLISVFDVLKHKFRIISYEEDQMVAKRAQACPVGASLAKIPTIFVQVVPTAFFDNAAPLHSIRDSGRFIYFLDDTKTFREPQAEVILSLLASGLLREADWLLITSCLTPRVVRQANFMGRFQGAFRLFYKKSDEVDLEFRIRNHVDLLLAMIFSRYQAMAADIRSQLIPCLIAKYKYRDTRSEMGLWLFRIDAGRPITALADRPFEPFLEEIEQLFKEKEAAVPNIFD